MEAINWLPVIAAGGSVLAVIRFWVELGKVWRQAEDTALSIGQSSVKIDRLSNDLSDHKVEIARNYATNADVERAIDRLDSTLRQYLDAVTREHKGP